VVFYNIFNRNQSPLWCNNLSFVLQNVLDNLLYAQLTTNTDCNKNAEILVTIGGQAMEDKLKAGGYV